MTQVTHPVDYLLRRVYCSCGGACAPVPGTSSCNPIENTFPSDQSGIAEKGEENIFRVKTQHKLAFKDSPNSGG